MTFYAFPGIKNCLNPDPFFFAFHFILNINKILVPFKFPLSRSSVGEVSTFILSAFDFIFSIRNACKIKLGSFLENLVNKIRHLGLVRIQMFHISHNHNNSTFLSYRYPFNKTAASIEDLTSIAPAFIL